MRTVALGYANSSHARQVDVATLAACLRGERPQHPEAQEPRVAGASQPPVEPPAARGVYAAHVEAFLTEAPVSVIAEFCLDHDVPLADLGRVYAQMHRATGMRSPELEDWLGELGCLDRIAA